MTSKKLVLTLAVVALLMVAAHSVDAQGIVICGSPGQDACEASHLFGMIYRVVNLLVSTAGLISILFIVIGGVQMLISGGDPGRVGEAKKTMFNAILGLIIVLISYIVVSYVAVITAGDLSPTGDPLLRRFLPLP